MSSLAAHHDPNSNGNLLPSRPEHHFLCCWLLLPRPSCCPSLGAAATSVCRNHYPNPGLSRQTRAPTDLIAELPRQRRLKAPTFLQRTDGKRRNEQGLIQEAGFWTADGANTRRNRGTPPAPSSSDQEAAADRTSSSLVPRTRATGRPPQLAVGTAWNPQCTRGALQTKPARPKPPPPAAPLHRRKPARAPASTVTRRPAQGTSGLAGSARSPPAPSTVRAPIRHRRPNRAAPPPGRS